MLLKKTKITAARVDRCVSEFTFYFLFLFNRDQMHAKPFLCFGDLAIASGGRSSYLTSCLRRAGENRKQADQQADFQYHLTVGLKMTKTHQTDPNGGSARWRWCCFRYVSWQGTSSVLKISGGRGAEQEQGWGCVGARTGDHLSVCPDSQSPDSPLVCRDSPCVFRSGRVSSFRIHSLENPGAGSSCYRDAPIRIRCVRRAVACVRSCYGELNPTVGNTVHRSRLIWQQRREASVSMSDNRFSAPP